MRENTVYMPDGRPAPILMTESEVIQMLRLEECGASRPEYAMQRLRDSGRLKSIRISRKSAYRLSDVLNYLEQL